MIMTFEEEFPSLQVQAMFTKEPYMPEIVSLPTNILRNCCLDKSRVKEAIKKCLWNVSEGEFIKYDELFKELKLK